MRNRFSRRFFLGSAAASVASGAFAQSLTPEISLRPVLRGKGFYKRAVRDAQSIIRAEKLTGNVAFAVADARTGAWLECENEQMGTPPASTAKAITALYALETLGADHQFETRLCVTGGIQDGVVQGDLVLIGGGDPLLDTNGLAEMAAQLKAAGVRAVKGDFKVFEASLPVMRQIDPEQPDQVGYNPGVSGLALNFNRVHFEWKRGNNGYAVTMDGRTAKYRPEVAMAVMQVRDRKAPIYTYEDRAGRDNWTVARGALGKGGSRWLPVRKPGLYAGDVFATLAGSHGIRLGRPQVVDALPPGEVIVTRKSIALRGILRGMLKYSTNLTAEMVGLAASTKRMGAVPNLRASAAEMNRWAIAALGMTAPKLVDHSGLGDDSTMTTLDMARALVKAHEGGLRPILKPIAMRDTKGRPVKEHPVTVDAKTGTLNFVSGLAGYMTVPDGRVLAFAILAANPAERAKIRRADRERPPGTRTWNRRAKRVQQALIERWATLYGAEGEG
ncbi:D-alanyl-D-alanine carboxypeptidase/D-alanyl-D-alanine-endopeptidase [Sulfitobacter sp. TSTF-M16]|uniref:D-alanyl-D-alanine carboxypeptidase/D-alanyl-D-alanine-endopeptidase n=1 Tax=Sulfitobacter aestuariivivens TaxID=2766981 RepID=A0A927D681_9RHOB|nr:D-alanyl-D-alanine carboxypeptidase/D-alanyl-D-alanine-endopeptidase [Sulfitobacter aestuariivivens]MBD3665898.1 D-alanyl-D-alanine carboxypeptidase/D-alanyl-D-alanine-endopeptidase [Sulfitobacter aestuariivivens]